MPGDPRDGGEPSAGPAGSFVTRVYS